MSTPKKCLVIDIEATCWDDGIGPPNPKSDIIEIGLATISLPAKEVIETRSIIVLPTSSKISEFCTRLTTLTPEFVAKYGIPFKDAIRIITEYKADKNMWASWGEYDKNKFVDQCKKEDIEYPFNNIHLNVKSLFAWKYGFNCKLEKAASHIGIEFEGTLHRAVCDSLMTAKILMEL